MALPGIGEWRGAPVFAMVDCDGSGLFLSNLHRHRCPTISGVDCLRFDVHQLDGPPDRVPSGQEKKDRMTTGWPTQLPQTVALRIESADGSAGRCPGLQGIARWAKRCPPLLLALVACSAVQRDARSLKVSSGATIAELAGSAAATVFLIYHPADCISCGGPIGEWIDAGVRRPDLNVVLLLSTKPQPLELRRLRAAGLGIPEWIPDWPPAAPTPRAYLLRDGEIADSAESVSQIDILVHNAIDRF